MSVELIWRQDGRSKAVTPFALHTSFVFVYPAQPLTHRPLSHRHGNAMTKILMKSPTLIMFNILLIDMKGNHLLSKPMALQVLDRRWHSDALLELPRLALVVRATGCMCLHRNAKSRSSIISHRATTGHGQPFHTHSHARPALPPPPCLPPHPCTNLHTPGMAVGSTHDVALKPIFEIGHGGWR